MEKIKKIQSILLDMLGYLDSFLNDNQIQYYLIGGSALGAERHSGFIPWDDDIDIGIPRSDFQRLKNILILRKTNNELYNFNGYVNNENYRYNYMKMEYKLSLFKENKYKDSATSGIFIDIFPLDGAPNGKWSRMFKVKYIYILRSLKYSVDMKLTKKNFYYLFFAKCLAFAITLKRLTNLINKSLFKQSFEKSNLVGNYLGAYANKELMKKEIFGPGKIIQFENINTKVPSKIKDYLTNLYGDYMTLPPIEKRVAHHLERVIFLDEINSSNE